MEPIVRALIGIPAHVVRTLNTARIVELLNIDSTRAIALTNQASSYLDHPRYKAPAVRYVAAAHKTCPAISCTLIQPLWWPLT